MGIAMLVRIAFVSAALVLVACGGGGGDGAGGGVQPGGAPIFTSASTASVPEGAVGAVYTATASGGGVAFTISGGADQARFTIDRTSGALQFTIRPDFERPVDADRNNRYDVALTATNSAGAAVLALSVQITDGSGAPAVRRVAQGFEQPLFLAGGGPGGQLFVVERAGRIRLLDPATGQIAATAFLDIRGEVSTTSEQGLLGFALAPDYATSGVFYLNLTNLAGDTEIRRYRRAAGAIDRADPATNDVILTFDQPAANHNGGWIGFGPDGLLYIGSGDGGGSGDPSGNAQNRSSLLGKILRIDVRGDAFPADGLRDYLIPSANPFASAGGAPEIFTLGFRNPFRAGFDRQTGALYVGDVGQDAIEEIDLIRPQDGGRNYGWNILEGARSFAGGSTSGLTPPIAEYPHGTGPLEGRSVTGGYVYRGPVAALHGNYVFGDFISARIWSIPASAVSQGATLANTRFTDRTAQFQPDQGSITRLASFAEDLAGNLYIVDFDGEVFVVGPDD